MPSDTIAPVTSFEQSYRFNYTFEFWWQYVGKCRQEAARLDVDMRTLDKALWQYSKNQG